MLLGIQAVYQHVKGVTNAVSGYAGGAQKDAIHDTVSSGRTGHAEAVQVTLDPKQISTRQDPADLISRLRTTRRSSTARA
jgi:peptide-methionine (S)-S-oxide reductase